MQVALPHWRAAKSIMERHYVDDMLDSADSVQEAIQLAQQVRDVHIKANIYIRNWMSNSLEFLTALGEHSTSSEFCQAGNRIDQVIEPERVLGMCVVQFYNK